MLIPMIRCGLGAALRATKSSLTLIMKVVFGQNTIVSNVITLSFVNNLQTDPDKVNFASKRASV